MRSKKNPRLFKIREGKLGLWSVGVASALRQKELARLVRRDGAVTVFRRLNALAVLTKRRNLKTHSIALADRDWVKRKFMKS